MLSFEAQTNGTSSSNKNWPKFVWKSFEEKRWFDPPIYTTRSNKLLHQTIHLRTQYEWSFYANTYFPYIFIDEKIWANMIDLANHKAWDIHGLKHELLKWVTNCEAKPSTLSVVIQVGACISHSTINTHYFSYVVQSPPMFISTHNLFHEEGTNIEKYSSFSSLHNPSPLYHTLAYTILLQT